MSINTKTFVRALRTASALIERRNTIPILSNVLVRSVSNGKLRLSATDLDNQVDVLIEGTTDVDSFTFGMPGQIAQALSIAGAEETEIVTVKGSKVDSMMLRSGDLEVELPTLPVEDWPTALDTISPTWSAVVGADFLRACRQVFGAVSHEETRYYLNGIFINRQDAWRYVVVCTDGHRLHERTVSIPDGSGGEFEKSIMPRRLLGIAFDVLGNIGDAPVQFSLGRQMRVNKAANMETENGRPNALMRFSVDLEGISIMLTGKTIGGTFPDYKRVFPQGNDKAATFKTADLRRVVNAINVGLGKRSTQALKITFQGGKAALVSQWGAMLNKVSLQVPCEGTVPDGFSIGINGNHLNGALEAVNGAEEFAMQMADTITPIIVRGSGMDDFNCLLMPIQM